MNEEEKALVRQKRAGYEEVERIHLEELRRQNPSQKLDQALMLMAYGHRMGWIKAPQPGLTVEQESWLRLKRAYGVA